MNFGRIQIPNNILIFKSDEYEYEYYSEFQKLFGILKIIQILFVGNIWIIGLNYSNNNERILG